MSNFEKMLPHSTVRLVGLVNGNAASTGTGFYYFFNDTFTNELGETNSNGSARIGIVTNKHVLEGMQEIIFFFNSAEEDEVSYHADSLRIVLNEETVINHPEDDVDLCVILAHSIIGRLDESNKKLHIYPVRKNIQVDGDKLKSMNTIQNLLMIGYPNGIWDSVNNLPMLRRGINATPLYENYMGKEEFAMDIATYRGSSGSPIFIYDNGCYIENNEAKFGSRIIFVGILKGLHRRVQQHEQGLETEEMLHIGIAIKASKLDVFDDLIRRHYEGE